MKQFKIDYFKGIDTSVHPNLLKNQAQMIDNLSIRDGALRTMRGTKVVATVPTLPNIQRLMVYYKAGEPILMASDNNYIYSWRGDWQKIDTRFHNGRFDYVNFNCDDEDIICFTNGVNNQWYYNDTDLKPIKLDGKDSTSGLYAPKGFFNLIHMERLWVADSQNVYCSTADYRGFSIHDWTTPTSPESEVNRHGAQIFMYDDTGSKITGMCVCYDDILIFKEKKVFKIYGTEPSNYQKVELFNGSGCLADKTLITTNKGLFYVGNGIFHYDGSNITKISTKIDKIWETIDQNKLQDAYASFWNDRYIVSLKTIGSDKHDIIIELDTNNMEFVVRKNKHCFTFANYFNNLMLATNEGVISYYDIGEYEEGEWISGVLTDRQGVIDLEQIKLLAEGNGTITVTAIGTKKSKSKIVNVRGKLEKVLQFSLSSREVTFKLKLDGDVKVKSLIADYDVDID